MKIFKLKKLKEWSYDECTDVVVVADNKKEAREIAASASLAEGKDTWLNESLSSCKKLKPSKKGVVVQHIAYG